ncbi:hypothetical protein LWI28_003178 [Acer negundo]|uniref:N-acetyltransferase domain-containing protein n=1 Tax=Acer negundo TaxID=4023 RepID=A0AAD5JHC2_ACENE|nr:hypothetical protein LWI28_003178 [Acer negundo]
MVDLKCSRNSMVMKLQQSVHEVLPKNGELQVNLFIDLLQNQFLGNTSTKLIYSKIDFYIEQNPSTAADIGFVSVKPGSDHQRCRGLISYALGSKYWGKGITTEAVKLAVPLVFEEFPDMKRLQAIVDVDNKASERVLEKAGFIKEGVFRKYIIVKGKTIDAAVYSLLSSD